MPHPTPEALDQADPLAAYRERFHLPDGLIDLDGNSLGALPPTTPAVLAQTVAEAWGRGLIKSWNTAGWIDLAAAIASDLATITGCAPDEIAVGDSISVNLFKLPGAARSLRPDRPTILADHRNFPADLYIAQGFTALTAQARASSWSRRPKSSLPPSRPTPLPSWRATSTTAPAASSTSTA